MIEINDKNIKDIILDANKRLEQMNFKTYIDRDNFYECTFIRAINKENEKIKLLFDVFDDYSLLMNISLTSGNYMFDGDIDELFKHLKNLMKE